jgi:hypothetical protein
MEVSGQPHTFSALPPVPTEHKDGYRPHGHSGRYREKKDLLPQPGFESLECTAHSLVTNLTELLQLHSLCDRIYLEEARCTLSGFGGLEDARWPPVPKFAGSNPAEAVGFFRAKKSQARLPSEGK